VNEWVEKVAFESQAKELLPQDELFGQTARILGSHIEESRLGGTN
jgi:hypothetical protein